MIQINLDKLVVFDSHGSITYIYSTSSIVANLSTSYFGHFFTCDTDHLDTHSKFNAGKNENSDVIWRLSQKTSNKKVTRMKPKP